MSDIMRPVTTTGPVGIKFYCSGFYFSETGGTDPYTVIVRVGDGTGTIIWQHTIKASGSVGWDWDPPLEIAKFVPRAANDIHVTITGVGVCQGGIKGL